MTQKLTSNINGFSLIELMFAMVIGFVLIGSVIQLFASMNAAAQVQREAAYMQENGRLAIELLSRDIRNSDYWGCAGQENVGSVLNTTSEDYDPIIHGAIQNASGVTGEDNVGIYGADTITLRGSIYVGDITVDEHNINSASIKVSGSDVDQLTQGQIVVLSNCQYADMFQITNDPATSGQTIVHNSSSEVSPGNAATYNQNTGYCTNCFQTSYQNTGASILLPYAKTYSILQGANGKQALFLTNSTNCTLGCELIEGVEDMQLLYGEDTSEDQTVDLYVSASEVIEMKNVIAIKLSLLVKTDKAVSTTTQNLTFNGATKSYEDGFMRKVYASTITLRNRL